MRLFVIVYWDNRGLTAGESGPIISLPCVSLGCAPTRNGLLSTIMIYFTVAGFHQVVNPNTWLLHLRLCQVSAVYNLDSSLRLCFSQESEDLVHVALAGSACIVLGDVGWGRPLGSDKHLGAPGVTGTASQPHTSVCIAVLQHTPIHRLVIAPRPFHPEFSSPR